MASHAEGVDLVLRYDVRRLGDLILDDDTRAEPGAISGHPVVQAMLSDATGLINSALLAGDRYSLIDINIFGTALSEASKNLLKRMCCDLAYGLLLARRGYSATDTSAMAPRYMEAKELLEQLKQGDRIFDLLTTKAAGLVQQAKISSKVPLFSRELDRYFGLRQSNMNENSFNRE